MKEACLLGSPHPAWLSVASRDSYPMYTDSSSWGRWHTINAATLRAALRSLRENQFSSLVGASTLRCISVRPGRTLAIARSLSAFISRRFHNELPPTSKRLTASSEEVLDGFEESFDVVLMALATCGEFLVRSSAIRIGATVVFGAPAEVWSVSLFTAEGLIGSYVWSNSIYLTV